MFGEKGRGKGNQCKGTGGSRTGRAKERSKFRIGGGHGGEKHFLSTRRNLEVGSSHKPNRKKSVSQKAAEG